MEELYGGNVVPLTLFDFNGNKLTTFKSSKCKQGIIIFYAPWCKHCKDSIETFEHFANYYKNDFIVAAVNCEKQLNYALKWRLKISYYPTIKYFDVNGNLTDYNEDTDLDSLVHFATAKISELSAKKRECVVANNTKSKVNRVKKTAKKKKATKK